MLWETSERCQEGKVHLGMSWEVVLVGLEGLWTQVLTIWTIYVHLFSLFWSRSAQCSHQPHPQHREQGKAKLQPWLWLQDGKGPWKESSQCPWVLGCY